MKGKTINQLSLVCVVLLVAASLCAAAPRQKQKQTQAKKKDFYELLGVARSANAREIKKAFHRISREYHPDHAPEGKKEEYQNKYAEISQAYAVLSDDEKRKKYDRFGDANVSDTQSAQFFDFGDLFRGFGGFGGFESDFTGHSGGGFSSFGSAFQGSRGGGGPGGGRTCATQTVCDGRGCRTTTTCSSS